MIVGLAVAESYFDAEIKARKWAKNWEPQGYKYHGTEWFDFSKIDTEDVIYMAGE